MIKEQSPMGVQSVNFFPAQMLTDKERNDDYYQQCIDAGLAIVNWNLNLYSSIGIRNTRKNKIINYNLFNDTAEVNTFLRAAQVKWMCEPLLNNEGDNSSRMRLHNIRSIPYLKECASWNSDGNFDRVSAMGAVMLYDLELGNVEIIKSTENIKTRANDPYFDKFFKSKSKMLNSW